MSNLTFKARVTDYESADAFLHGKGARKLAHNTWVERLDADRIAVRYHETHIVTYTRDLTSIALDGGGWVSVTTSRRMNMLTPEGVYVAKRGDDYKVDDSQSKTHGATMWDGVTPLVVWP